LSSFEIVAILALTAYSLYKQSHRRILNPAKRFLLPLIYVAVGLAVGGFVMPSTVLAWTLLIAGLLLSIVTGVVRGLKTRVWIEGDDRYAQGTALTIGLFLGMVAIKWVFGAIGVIGHDGAPDGFGEIIFSIGLMMVVQAEIVHRRARALVPAAVAPVTAPVA
jgi:hypothetical protein